MATVTDLDRDLDNNLALRLRIEALNADYIHTIDDDRLEEWPELFTEDGVYRVTSRENAELDLPVALIYCEGHGMFHDRISALRQANIFEPHTYCHMVSALQVQDVDDGRIRTKSNFTIVRTMAEGGMTVFACGRYLDEIVEVGGALKFAARSVILESRRIDTLLVIPI